MGNAIQYRIQFVHFTGSQWTWTAAGGGSSRPKPRSVAAVTMGQGTCSIVPSSIRRASFSSFLCRNVGEQKFAFKQRNWSRQMKWSFLGPADPWVDSTIRKVLRTTKGGLVGFGPRFYWRCKRGFVVWTTTEVILRKTKKVGCCLGIILSCNWATEYRERKSDTSLKGSIYLLSVRHTALRLFHLACCVSLFMLVKLF